MALTWSEDVRWMVVWRREFRGQSYRHITKRWSAGPRRKGPSRKTIKRIVARFRREGDVKTRQGARKAPPANRIFDRRNDKALLRVLADSPGDMLDEIRDKLTARTGAQPHLSTVCRAIWRLRHSRKRVRQCATPRARTTAAHGRRHLAAARLFRGAEHARGSAVQDEVTDAVQEAAALLPRRDVEGRTGPAQVRTRSASRARPPKLP